jgi:hypothetical protein
MFSVFSRRSFDDAQLGKVGEFFLIIRDRPLQKPHLN